MPFFAGEALPAKNTFALSEGVLSFFHTAAPLLIVGLDLLVLGTLAGYYSKLTGIKAHSRPVRCSFDTAGWETPRCSRGVWPWRPWQLHWLCCFFWGERVRERLMIPWMAWPLVNSTSMLRPSECMCCPVSTFVHLFVHKGVSIKYNRKKLSIRWHLLYPNALGNPNKAQFVKTDLLSVSLGS